MASKRVPTKARPRKAPKKARPRKAVSAAPAAAESLKAVASAGVQPQLRPLFDALQCAHDAGDALYRCYDELQRAYVEANAPATWEYEGLPLSQREALEHMNDPEKAGKLMMHAEWSFPTGFDLPDAVQEFHRTRKAWRGAILSARRALDSEAVVVLMDGETALPASERWTTEVARELEEMRNAMPPSPFRRGVGYGEEGMAVLHAMRQLEQRCADLSRVSAAAVSKLPAASPDALSPRWEGALRVLEAVGANLHNFGPDAVADRAAEKLARTLPGLMEPQHSRSDAALARTNLDSTALAEPYGPTCDDLRDAGKVSAKTIGRVRDKAGVDHGLKGKQARAYRYTKDQIDAMLHALQSGGFMYSRQLTKAWRKWASNPSAWGPSTL